jgi:hypothetical protein
MDKKTGKYSCPRGGKLCIFSFENINSSLGLEHSILMSTCTNVFEDRYLLFVARLQTRAMPKHINSIVTSSQISV